MSRIDTLPATKNTDQLIRFGHIEWSKDHRIQQAENGGGSSIPIARVGTVTTANNSL